MLRFLTAGESHGRSLIAILEGMPAGLKIDLDFVNSQLKRRQMGFGRGKRMQIEKDTVKSLSGLKNNITLGSPIAIVIENKDFSIDKLHKVVYPRPGHADLAGLLKYGFSDIRQVLERASARSTAATVGVGAIAQILLREFGMRLESGVVSIGGETAHQARIDKIKEAIKRKDTLGGVFKVSACGVPVGLGSYVQPDRRLDSRLAMAVMGIPGIKGVEIGLGFGYADKFGSEAHDAIYYSRNKGFSRETNNAGGIEGGISNGEDIILSACMKPIATLMDPLDSVNINTGDPGKAATERSDICAVESAAVVAEAACAYTLAEAFLEKFGGDSLSDIRQSYSGYLKRIAAKRK